MRKLMTIREFEGLGDERAKEALERALADIPLELVVRWAPGGPLALFALRIRRAGREHSMISHVIGDNDGEIRGPIGGHPPGVIDITFGLFAQVDIPRVAIYVLVGRHPVPLFPAGANAFFAMASGDRVRQTVPFTVPGGLA